MNYKRSFELLWILIAAALISAFFSHKVSVVLLAAAIVQCAVFYRCPHCRRSLLNLSGGIPNSCPYCGEHLD